MKHFTRDEFTCKCGCGFDTIDEGLVKVLDELREHFDTPVIINSGCRCAEHNTAVGGSPRSQHVLGTAADVVVRKVPATEVYNWVVSNYPEMGVGRYSSFTHIDNRGHKARWYG